ncbi:MAG: Gfo/Idh/MocA family oxidoreductase [Ferruginibacter sp.]
MIKIHVESLLKNVSVAATGFFIVRRHVLGRGFIAPSDKLNIAGIGAGRKGESDLSEFSKSPAANIVVLCDVDDRSAANSRKRFTNAKYYKDFREMLAKEGKNIDAVSVYTPDHTHAVAALGPLTESILMGNLALRSWNIKEGKNFTGRKKLLWDAENMKITNYDPANQFVRRTYRDGYKFEL